MDDIEAQLAALHGEDLDAKPAVNVKPRKSDLLAGSLSPRAIFGDDTSRPGHETSHKKVFVDHDKSLKSGKHVKLGSDRKRKHSGSKKEVKILSTTPESTSVSPTPGDTGHERLKKAARSAFANSSSEPKSSSWKCCFCRRGTCFGGLRDLYGPYIVPKKHKSKAGHAELSPGEEIWFHQDCIYWAPGVYALPNAGSEMPVGLLDCLEESLITLCMSCGEPGATVGCIGKRCCKSYHLPCAYASDCDLDTANLHMLCVAHKVQKPRVLPFFLEYGDYQTALFAGKFGLCEDGIKFVSRDFGSKNVGEKFCAQVVLNVECFMEHQRKNEAKKRPLSPCLRSYEFNMNMFNSISHRLTGAGLTGVFYGSVLVYMCAMTPFPDLINFLSTFEVPVLFGTVKFLTGWWFTYHLLAGVRHMLWDFGQGLTNASVFWGGIGVEIVSFFWAIYLAFF
ncbi:unnamed protein product [Notodromas monacha]|uniref:PHD-type domain-containing protein n=1 Tax=Notodromas monacha TaxID=399045 RepID=A0A7R9GFT2_9CRUS|nr:unnamed protein product [Notodromas monacha]CAG0921002.1 unnamed protein product [Notodromas monacha]